jgi:hypothetical protein
MDNAGLEKRDREHQYRLTLLRGVPDESLLRSEPHSAVKAAGAGKIKRAVLTVTPAPKEKKSELRRSKRKSSGRNRSKQH